jgi:hypothetical protein
MQINSQSNALTTSLPSANTPTFADTMTTVARAKTDRDHGDRRVDGPVTRWRPRMPPTETPPMPKPPKGGPVEPPRCFLPLPPSTTTPKPTPKPICDLPPPMPNPDPRYLGPPICELPAPTPGPKPVPLPVPFDINPDFKPTGGVGMRGPFPTECPAPLPPRTELFSTVAISEATMADSE